jgi:hypothetical protein
MYQLVDGDYGVHSLRLSSASDQLTAYAFTFGAWSIPGR